MLLQQLSSHELLPLLAFPDTVYEVWQLSSGHWSIKNKQNKLWIKFTPLTSNSTQ